MLKKIKVDREYSGLRFDTDEFSHVVIFDYVQIEYNNEDRMDAILFAVGGEGQYEDACDIDYVDFLKLNLNLDESEFIHPTLDRISDDDFKKLNSIKIRFDFEKLLGNSEVYIMQEIIKKLNTLGFDCKIDGGFLDHDNNKFVKYKIVANKAK